MRIAVGSDPKAAPTHPASIWPFSAGDGAHPAVPPLGYKIINKYAEIVGVG